MQVVPGEPNLKALAMAKKIYNDIFAEPVTIRNRHRFKPQFEILSEIIDYNRKLD